MTLEHSLVDGAMPYAPGSDTPLKTQEDLRERQRLEREIIEIANVGGTC
jgi:hypothetical protein